MNILGFLRSGPGRAFRVALGCVLVGIGVQDDTLVGVLLVMVGLVPIVSGLANICLVDDLVSATQTLGHRGPRALRHKP